MTKRILYLVCAAYLFACGTDPSPEPHEDPGTESPSLTEEQEAHLASMVEAFVTAERFPSLAIGVVQGGELVSHAGYGRGARSGLPPDEDTLYGIGSVTKTFTATALLTLVEDDVLSLDDEAAKWIPELEAVVSPSGGRPVTLRHLLDHSSGLPRDTTLPWIDEIVTEEELLAELAEVSLLFTPGTTSRYSNVGLALAGIVISRASGQTYESFVEERVLAPLGMDATVFGSPDSGAAPGHLPHPMGGYDPSGIVWRQGVINPAGGIFSSVRDLVGLVRHGLGQASILSPGMLAESQTPLRTNPRDISYGLGWLVSDEPGVGQTIWHGGSTGDYGAHVAVVPGHDLGVIVLSGSAAYGDAFEVESLGNAVLAYLLDPETSVVPEKSVTPQSAIQTVGDRLLAYLEDPSTARGEETAGRLLPSSRMPSMSADFFFISRAGT